MRKINFTVPRVKAFKCDEERDQIFFRDAGTPGLAVRVTASGGKAYVFESKLHGQSFRITIGDERAWALDKARVRARELTTLVDQGVDPRERKANLATTAAAKRMENKRQSVTLGDVWSAYLEDCKCEWSERHYLDHIALAHPGGVQHKRGKGITVAAPLAELMPLRLIDLTSGVISDWLVREGARRPGNTTQSYRLLRAFKNWCEGRKQYNCLIPANAFKAREVSRAVPKSKAKEGDCLQREQLRAWFGAVRQIANPVIQTYLQSLLLSGARPRAEWLNLKWENVDFQWSSITIHDKVKGERVIPLTPFVASLLESLPRYNEWVFSSSISEDKRLQEPRIGHNLALNRAGLPHVTLHGLRRSFGTLAEWTETPVGIVAQIMGHAPSALVEKHYRRRPLDLLRKWHTKLEAWILREAGIVFEPSNYPEATQVPAAIAVAEFQSRNNVVPFKRPA